MRYDWDKGNLPYASLFFADTMLPCEDKVLWYDEETEERGVLMLDKEGRSQFVETGPAAEIRKGKLVIQWHTRRWIAILGP